MSGSRILWGQLLLVALIVLLFVWGATEWVAWRLGFQSQLGPPMGELLGLPIYPPPAFFVWWYWYDAYAPDPAIFQSGRNLAAWIRLVPKQNSSGGKERLGSICKTGNRYLRQMLIVGAMAVIRHAERNAARRPWLVQLLARRKAKVLPLRSRTRRKPPVRAAARLP